MIGRSMSRAGTTTRVAISRPDGWEVGSGVAAGETEGSCEPDGDGHGDGVAGCWVAVTSDGASKTSGVGSTPVPAVVGSAYVSRPAVIRTTPSAVRSAGTIRDVSMLKTGAMASES